MPRTKDSPPILELRQRLLHAAGEVFAERGFRAATTREITERAGVNLAAINYHFRDKAELYASALREAHCSARMIGLPEPRGTPRARLQTHLSSMLTFLLDPHRPAWQNRLLNREIAEPSPALDEFINEGMRPRTQRMFGILRDLARADLTREQLAWLSSSIMAQCLHFSQNRAIIERIHPSLAGYHQHVDLLAARITEFSVPAIQAAGRKARAAAANP